MTRTKMSVIIAAMALTLAGCENVNVNINMNGAVQNEQKPEASETQDIDIGTTGYAISIPSDYYSGEVTKDDRKDDQIAYYKSDEHLMDFDVYQFGKDGMSLGEYAKKEAEEYKADGVEEVKYNGIPMMLYYSQEEYEGEEYRVANYIFENFEDFAELSFWLDGDDAEELVEQIMSSIRQQQMVGLANPWIYDLTAEEVKERTGCEFIVPEGAYDVAFGVNENDGLAEMNFTMDDVRYCARMKKTEDYEDISGLFYEWDAEGVDRVGEIMADVRLNTPENISNVIWFDNGMMYSLYTGDADKEGLEVVKMANLVFAGGGSRSENSDEADHAVTDIDLGTTGFKISIPSDYYSSEVTKEERKDDQIAYYKSDEHLMDFDVYQFGKDGMTLEEYAKKEAREYKADGVEEVTYNGISMMLYYSQEEYDGESYRVANYIFENDDDFAELSFWLDGDDAEELVEQILFSIYLDTQDMDDGVMHAY